MTLDTIIKLLEKYGPAQSGAGHSDGAPRAFGTVVWYCAGSVILPGAVHVVPEGTATVSGGSGAIFLAPQSADISKLQSPCLVFGSSYDAAAIYHLLQKELDGERRVSKAAETFFDALYARKTLEQMVDVAYELLGNPIHVSDMGHILLAASSHGADNVPAWTETEYARFPLSDEHVQRMNLNNRDIDRSDTPIIIPREVYQRRLIGAKVCVQDRLVAYIYVIESNKRFEKEDFSIVSLFAETLSTLFGSSSFWRNTKGKGYEYLLTELLNGGLTDRAEIKRWFSGIDIRLMPHFLVLTIQKAKEAPRDIEGFDAVGSWLESNIPLTRTVIYEKRMVAVVNSREKKELDPPVVEQLQQLLRRGKMVMGFSKDTTDICTLQELYFQSIQAIKIGESINGDCCLYHYQDYAAYDMLLSIVDHEAVLALAHPGIRRLYALDAENDGQLYGTLRACVNRFGNLHQAAKDLNTNYNTVKYRIKRIGELTGISLLDEENIFYLYLSFLLDDLDRNAYTLDKG